MSLVKALPRDIQEKYDVVVVSPRNYFLYTPLLPAVAVGTVEEGSICEPVRLLVKGKGEYYEASCQAINPDTKELIAAFPSNGSSSSPKTFQIKYDLLVVGVGSVNNTFGVKGVEQHCLMFKTIEDAHKLRGQLSDCFERAALPYVSQAERERLLSFVVVGGGPTGIEVAAELHDVIHEDLKGLYPSLMPDVKQLQELFPQQQLHSRCVFTDDHLRVKGSDGSIFACGDAATIHYPSALELTNELFDQADEDKDGRVSLRQLQELLQAAARQDSSLDEHLHYLQAHSNRFAAVVSGIVFGLTHPPGSSQPGGQLLQWQDKLTREEFRAVLDHVDRGLRALPATAQVAKQQGEYIADLLVSGRYSTLQQRLELPTNKGPFKYFHKGSLLYVGGDKAGADLPLVGPLVGYEAGLLWHSYETFAQISLRNQAMVALNWLRTKLFGRNISHI
ncbi:hypothetical protein OEZ86_009686 [Tetradesmus obliquus]|uniref:NADH:ubiquinone reductase (non-electrogenic) n=1 Tax=Tetradesmus obliquus TaxID=3088 RepID=A0ABY8UR18_TETOB|nr:hypothetical protein OEZ85_001130 [Tetradesmus obliquus]WIA43175.1 hypothetical protein OEZ86_009686 [Tetradesmus obliquus]